MDSSAKTRDKWPIRWYVKAWSTFSPRASSNGTLSVQCSSPTSPIPFRPSPSTTSSPNWITYRFYTCSSCSYSSLTVSPMQHNLWGMEEPPSPLRCHIYGRLAQCYGNRINKPEPLHLENEDSTIDEILDRHSSRCDLRRISNKLMILASSGCLLTSGFILTCLKNLS